jgi:hypothetical protein
MIHGPEELEDFPNKLPEDLLNIWERKLRSYRRLDRDIRLLIEQINVGCQPLSKHCRLCDKNQGRI